MKILMVLTSYDVLGKHRPQDRFGWRSGVELVRRILAFIRLASAIESCRSNGGVRAC
jgi:hypothetical protein